ncbi:Six-hairpin glycosidase-like protein [Aspergillus californicus]
MPPRWPQNPPWIWTPSPTYTETQQVAQFVHFRKTFSLDSIPEKINIHVSADTRYRLYVNGTSVLFGPAKSHLNEWNYETFDIAPFCREGVNVLAARVLRYSPVMSGNMGMARAGIPGFVLAISTNTPWKCKIDDSTRIQSAEEWNPALGPAFLLINEDVDGSKAERGWTGLTFDDSTWDTAAKSTMKVPMLPILEPWRLVPRSIPLLPEIPGRFCGVINASHGLGEKWRGLVLRDGVVEIPPRTTASVVLENQTLTTAFLDFGFRGGAASKITIRCAECFEKPQDSPNPFARSKGDRSDTSGILVGPEDFYTVSSSSPSSEESTYSPFWFRTFRYIALTITTQSTPLTLTALTYRETHYPLPITTTLTTAPPSERQKWSISLTTLLNCMHETYADCPFYEQNQFAMDSRLQILFSYQLSRDDRLARKCINEFHASRRACDGLVETHYPSPFPGVNIPVFSLYWVLMIHDHMMYFGDRSFVKRFLGGIDGVLNFFESRVVEGYGLVGRFDGDAWAFVDWTREWSDIGPGGDFKNLAVPPGYRRGEGMVSYISLVYAFVLGKAAELSEFVGRRDVAQEYRDRAGRLNAAVLKHCLRRTPSPSESQSQSEVDTAEANEDEFLIDSPSSPTTEISQHTQVFAVLSGAISGPHAKRILHRALSPSTNSHYVRCSYAMSFYVFEAAIQTGLYDELRTTLVQPWNDMMALNLTTWAESAAMPRSDCHGWSAVPVYDVVANVVGLRPAAAGYQRVRFEPRARHWEGFEGVFCVGGGEVRVSWSGGKVSFIPGLDVEVEVPDRAGGGYVVRSLRKGETLTLDL